MYERKIVEMDAAAQNASSLSMESLASLARENESQRAKIASMEATHAQALTDKLAEAQSAYESKLSKVQAVADEALGFIGISPRISGT